MFISPHITPEEATRTAAGLPNVPTSAQLKAMQLLAVNVFEPLRLRIGGAVMITSFFRCKEVNAKVGGASTSQHVKGEAMDIKKPGRNKALFEIIRNQLSFEQLIWEFGTDVEPSWVHVSYKATGNRSQILRAKKVNGKTIYETL